MLESLEERTEILVVTPKKKSVGGTESWKRSEGLRHSESNTSPVTVGDLEGA